MPLICTKCDRSETVREGNETHCRFCGNVEIDGVKARWPFEEREALTGIQLPRERAMQQPDKNADDRQSPLQLAKGIKDKETDMSKKKCSVAGCESSSWVEGLCHKHYGEQKGEYTPKKKYPPRKTTIEDSAEKGTHAETHSEKQGKRTRKPTNRKSIVVSRCAPIAAAEETANREPGNNVGVESEARTDKKDTTSLGHRPGILNPDRLHQASDVTDQLTGLNIGDVAIIVKFTHHADLLEGLTAYAKKEFRDLDSQILHIIDQYLTDRTVVNGSTGNRILTKHTQDMIVKLWIDALDRNVLGLRNVLESANG